MNFFLSVLMTLVSFAALTFAENAEAQRWGNGPGRGGHGRPDYGRPDPGRGGYGRPDHGRPDFGRPNPGGYGRPDYGRNDFRDRRRSEVRRYREYRYQERNRWQHDRFGRRNHWRRHPYWAHPRRDYRIHDSHFWGPRYNVWLGMRTRPSYFSFSYNWRRPMPTSSSWSYIDIEAVADNIEDLTEDIFESFYRCNPQMNPYLRQALIDLKDAAENFNDSVEARDDYDDTLYDLFYLDRKLSEAESEVRRSQFSAQFDNQMRALRYYVDEMLYTYRQNH